MSSNETRPVSAPARVGVRDLIPHADGSASWRSLWPSHPAVAAAQALLMLLLVIYGVAWISGHTALLTDTQRTNDDSRTAIFPFHRFVDGDLLQNDPLADDMLAFTPPAYQMLYRVLAPVTGLFVAQKLVQGLCLALIVLAGLLLARSPRWGLVGGVLLIFFMLQSFYVTNRIAGGLPRAFAFPALALWISGALAGSERIRFSASLLGALTYPSVMLMTLGAEGVLALLNRAGGWRPWLMRGVRYVLLVGACGVAIAPQMIANRDAGRVHTLAEAAEERAFYLDGRLTQIPFPDPVPQFARSMLSVFRVGGVGPVWQPSLDRGLYEAAPLLAFAVLIVLLMRRWARLNPAVGALAVSCIVGYWVARTQAFRFYAPERFYSVGMLAVGIFFCVAVLATVGWRLKPTWLRDAACALSATAAIGAVWMFLGGGIFERNGLSIDARENAALYAFVRELPQDVRIGVHPMDADLPYWTGRSTTDSLETLQPWIVEQWREYLPRVQRALQALYARDVADVLAWATEQELTHILLDVRRYGPQFREASDVSFEPLRGYVRQLLATREPRNLALTRLPRDAVAFSENQWVLIDVDLLRSALARPDN